MALENTHDKVQDYYGKTLQNKDDLATNACTLASMRMPKHVRQALGQVHPKVVEKFYGCGIVIPPLLEDTSVLDLGSGSGQDCFVLSKLVGEKGHVTGIDMTQEQLDVANSYIDFHTQTFGYSKPNTNYVHGYIEKLTEAGIQENTYDIIISNCVINLSPDKKAVIQEAHKVLKEGGELYFSDIYTDHQLAPEIRQHEVLWGECVSGALDWKELVSIAKEVGFSTPSLVTAEMFEIHKPELRKVLGDAQFVSATYRFFKLPSDISKSQEVSEATYTGGIPYNEEEMLYDINITFKKNQPLIVDAELATSIQASRYGKFYTFSKSTASPVERPVVDPFAYAQEKKLVAACCAPSTEQKSEPEPKQSNGSCQPAKTGCC